MNLCESCLDVFNSGELRGNLHLCINCKEIQNNHVAYTLSVDSHAADWTNPANYDSRGIKKIDRTIVRDTVWY